MRRAHSRSRGAPRPKRSGAAGTAAAPPVAALPPSHPATLTVHAAAAACVLAAVTFHIIDTDLWQHLAVGRALWETRTLPHTELWSWPPWGEPAVLRSWLFRAILWPFWHWGGPTGLFVWRWLTTLAAFALVLLAARRMGASGLAPAVVMVLCALTYRQRSQIRPETLAAVLLALTLWLLESRRHHPPARGFDRAWWLVVVTWVWVNAHISYLLGFALIGIHLVDAHVAAWRGKAAGAGPGGLWRVTAACAAVAFLNPYGWKAVWAPIDYFLNWRHTLPFQGIGELRPVGWSGNETNGIFVLLVGWPLLLIWRARRRGIDVLTSQEDGSDRWPDDRLLDAFVRTRDESAFAELVARHGPMVYAVCRRVTGHAHDAEDAFQAAFLVLASKGASVRQQGSLASWLYQVAYRIALKARADAARRRVLETQGRDMPEPNLPPDLGGEELRPVLDEELSRLAEKYRAPLVLHYFEGKTLEQAAHELGWPVGSMSRRLHRGRALLRTGFRLEEAAARARDAALADAQVPAHDIAYVLSTGYGRYQVPFRDGQITDLTAQARGARLLFPGTRTVLDIGGQTMKASRLDERGRVRSFRLNDKCAAGTGAFLEKTARYLGYRIEEIGPLVEGSAEPVHLSGVCAVFAESEVINHVSNGCRAQDIMLVR